MRTVLERLRQKSDIEKKTIALVAAAVIALVIFISWAATRSFESQAAAVADVVQGEESVIAAPLEVLTSMWAVVQTSVTAVQGVEE